MKPQCRAAVQQAAGRTLTDAEIKKIDDRISSTMRNMARADPAGWRSKSADQRVLDAAQQAAADIQGESALKVQRAQLQIVKTAAMEARVGDLMASYAIGRSQALVKEMELTDHYVEGIKRPTVSHLMDLLDAVGSNQGTTAGRKALMFLFDAENPGMTRDLAIEIYGNGAAGTGNALAQKAAKAWLESIEELRQRFNNAGGDVGQLEYGYLPQPHDQARVRGSGDAAARAKWVQETLPLLDRNRYFQEDGTRLTDQQLADVLNSAWDTIATGGLNKMTPGQGGGSGARANAGSESRQIHFKDAEAYLAYMGKYGGGSMYDAMLGHIGGLSRDIALVERYGPNPAQQMKLQFDLASRAEGRPVDDLPRSFIMRPQSYWDLLSGKAGMAENGNIARIMQDVRNVQVFGKLAGATVSSITDVNTYFVTTGFNKLSYWEGLKNIGKQFDGETRDFLTMHGIIADSMISNLNRWSGDNIKNNWSGRLANSTMKLSLMNAWTDTLRRAFSMTMMNGMAKLSKFEWARLSEYDQWRMKSKGITEEDWAVIRQAQLTTYQGADFLTPEAIQASGDARSNEVIAKVMGFITDESEYAVINPDMATKAAASWGGKSRGTVSGDILARTLMQFKSFPIAMVSRHWRRMLETPQGLDGAPMLANKLMYGSAMMLSLTAVGGIAFQIKQIISGKDPIDMTTPKFWMKAMAQGGGLGIVGDFLLTDPTSNGGDAAAGIMKSAAGPTAGSFMDIGYKLGVENIYEAFNDKEMHLGAELVRTTRSHVPYVNLWYGKAALDHAGLHALQENLSPGYLSRMQQRAQRDWNQDYWWAPDSGSVFTGDMRGPERAPDMTAIGGN